MNILRIAALVNVLLVFLSPLASAISSSEFAVFKERKHDEF